MDFFRIVGILSDQKNTSKVNSLLSTVIFFMFLIILDDLFFPNDDLRLDLIVDQFVTLQVCFYPIPIFLIGDPFSFKHGHQIFVGPLVILFYFFNGLINFFWRDFNSQFSNLLFSTFFINHELQYSSARFKIALFVPVSKVLGG